MVRVGDKGTDALTVAHKLVSVAWFVATVGLLVPAVSAMRASEPLTGLDDSPFVVVAIGAAVGTAIVGVLYNTITSYRFMDYKLLVKWGLSAAAWLATYAVVWAGVSASAAVVCSWRRARCLRRPRRDGRASRAHAPRAGRRARARRPRPTRNLQGRIRPPNEEEDLMKALVVYESYWGNTAQIATAIAEGIGADVPALHTDEATPEMLADVDLLVLGAPLMGFSLPREQMRQATGEDKKAPKPADTSHPTMREWLGSLPQGTAKYATFETRFKWSPGSAAGKMGRALESKGYRSAAKRPALLDHRHLRPHARGRDRSRAPLGRGARQGDILTPRPHASGGTDMQAKVVVTLTGPDRVGIVDEVTGALLELDANVETSRMARLGGEFAVLMLVSVPEDALDGLEAKLEHLAQRGYKLTVTRTDEVPSVVKTRAVPYLIKVVGADHEGIIHDIAHGLSRGRHQHRVDGDVHESRSRERNAAVLDEGHGGRPARSRRIRLAGGACRGRAPGQRGCRSRVRAEDAATL